MYETTVKYPEDLEFYYTPDEIGRCKHIGCEHYYSIFETIHMRLYLITNSFTLFEV